MLFFKTWGLGIGNREMYLDCGRCGVFEKVLLDKEIYRKYPRYHGTVDRTYVSEKVDHILAQYKGGRTLFGGGGINSFITIDHRRLYV